MISITRYHDICAGHRVYNQGGKCEHLHGHNYRVHFKVGCAELDKVGRVLDFSQVKTLLCQWLEVNWDHKFLLWMNDPFADLLEKLDPKGIVFVPFNPTAENMAKHLVLLVAPELLHKTDCTLLECTIEETRKCSATYSKEESHEELKKFFQARSAAVNI